MHFALLCQDKPDHLDLRMKIRSDHLAYLSGLGEKLAFAGPFLDEAGKPNGSLVVIVADDLAAAEAIAAADPYAQNDLFQAVEIRPWNWALNNPASPA
jgi:hypothetical protein